jgi:hypothetical protein
MFNDIFIFDIETKSWILPSVSGIPPSARASHTATKIDDFCFCIIGGGDLRFVFNDIHLYNVDSNTWIQIRTAGQ